MKLGDKLRTHREKRQWTQPKAAAAIGIEQSYLSKLENDHSIPSVEVFRRIVDAYETDVAALMEGINPAELTHLVEITDVADYLDAEREARKVRGRRQTRLQTISVALGTCLIYAGLSNLFFPSAVVLGQAWKNQSVTFVGIFALTYGLIGLLVAASRQKNRAE